MNGLTARLALDVLALQPGQTKAVTGAAGAFGGYVVQLAKAEGLTVIADASHADEELVNGLGADVVIRQRDDFPAQVRQRFAEGLDAAADGAVLGAAVATAVRDGRTIVAVRGSSDPAERRVTFQPIMVSDYATARDKLDGLRGLVEEGKVTLRVAGTFPKERAADAHRRLQAGGVRGRLVIEL